MAPVTLPEPFCPMLLSYKYVSDEQRNRVIMTGERLGLLHKPFQKMHKAAVRLNWSLQRCLPLNISQLRAEGEEKCTTLTARF